MAPISEDPAHDVLAAEEFGMPAPDPSLTESAAHDVLAAEEFGMPAPDPSLVDSEAHDVLAAEEFAMPAPDPTLHHPPVVLPADLTGASEPRDVLAAEEFAMPAPPEYPIGAVALRRAEWSGAAKALAAMLALAGVRRLARVLAGRARRKSPR